MQLADTMLARRLCWMPKDIRWPTTTMAWLMVSKPWIPNKVLNIRVGGWGLDSQDKWLLAGLVHIQVGPGDVLGPGEGGVVRASSILS